MAVSLAPDAVAVAGIRVGLNNRPSLMFSGRELVAEGTSSKKLLSNMLGHHRLQRVNCTSILPTNSYQTLQLDVTDLPLAEARQAARWQIGEHLDYPSADAIIDLYQITPFIGEKRPQSYAVAARRSLLREYVDILRIPGLMLTALDIPEFALRNICDLFTEDQRGVAILLLFERSGLLVVARDGVLYLARQLNMGMEHLQTASEEERESQFDVIVLDIQRSFDFCESAFQLPLVSRLLVAQTRQDIPQLVSYLDRLLAVRVEPLRLDTVMDLPVDADQLALNQQLLAIGGALRREND